MTGKHPKEWAKWLSLAELWYNFNFHTSIQSTPFEIVYGIAPPIHVPYLGGMSKVEAVNRTLKAREEAIQTIKFYLLRAQNKMKQQADKGSQPLTILDRRIMKKRNAVAIYGLVQWTNGSKEDATWEPLDKLVILIVNRIPHFGTYQSNAFVKQSCNGLLLCHDMEHNKYYVYNPSINLLKLLPQPHLLLSKIHYSMRMAFDPTKSPHYKVVYASISDENNDVIVSIQIQTYSSETDLMNERSILTNVQTPGTLHDWDRKLFESHGCLLLLGMAKTHSLQLNVYKMRNGNSEWSFKYFVNLCDIIKTISIIWIMCFSVLSIALGESE
ncbi:reverse transcriptase [Tanacetum coccineum]